MPNIPSSKEKEKQMVKKRQQRGSISDEEWIMVKEYFKNHKKELARKTIKTPTALVRLWIREGALGDETSSE